jgi:hypothetical protein
LLFISLAIFGIVVMANQTVLTPDFIVHQHDKLDLSLLTSQLLREQIPQQLEFTGEFLNDIVTDMEPEIKMQASGLIYSGYNYFTGKSEQLKLSISLVSVKDNLRKKIFENRDRIIPSYLSTATQTEQEQYLEDVYENMTKKVPDRLEYTQASWGRDIQQMLARISLTVGYFILGYRVLIGLIVFLIMGLFLFIRPVWKAVQILGIIALCAGLVQLILYFAIIGITSYELTQFTLPPALQAWLPSLINDFLLSLVVVSIIILLIGIILIVISRKHRNQKKTETKKAATTGAIYICFDCGARYEGGDKFCKICGAKIQHYCPQCGASIDLTEQFCPHCGNRLSEP